MLQVGAKTGSILPKGIDVTVKGDQNCTREPHIKMRACIHSRYEQTSLADELYDLNASFGRPFISQLEGN